MEPCSKLRSIPLPTSLPEPKDNDNSPSPIAGDNVTVDEHRIPTGVAVYFDNWTDSTLPSPDEVREAAKGPNLLKGTLGLGVKRAVQFPEHPLIIKYGLEGVMPVFEGQTLWLLSYVPSMRVPKIYGWCEDGGERFIYMEQIEGVTVQERWPSLSTPEKLSVAEQLNTMIASMRCLRQAPGNQYIGLSWHTFPYNSYLLMILYHSRSSSSWTHTRPNVERVR